MGQMKRSPLKRATYRGLRADEPAPESTPRVYLATDGRLIQRWKVAPRQYVERAVRNPDGTPKRGYPFRARRVDVAQAAELYRRGQSLPTIAAALKCDTGNLSRALRRRGVAMRTPADYATPLDSAEVVRRFTDGEGKVAIARDLGVSVSRVAVVLTEAGLPGRPSGAVRGRGKGPGRRVGFGTEFEAMKPHVRQRSGGRCEAQVSPNCSGRGSHVHHRKMRSQGGTNRLENLLDCCAFCHSYLHHHPALAYRLGLLVRREDDPASVPLQSAKLPGDPRR